MYLQKRNMVKIIPPKICVFIPFFCASQASNYCAECGMNYTGRYYAHKRKFHNLNRGGQRMKIYKLVSELNLPEMQTSHEMCRYISAQVTHFYRDLRARLVNEGKDPLQIPSEGALTDLPNILHQHSELCRNKIVSKFNFAILQ